MLRKPFELDGLAARCRTLLSGSGGLKEQVTVGPSSVDTQVLTLRRKLEQAGLGEGGGIETMRQQGYRFSLDNLPDPASMPLADLNDSNQQLSGQHQST